MQRASLLGDIFGCQVIADLAARYRVEHAILQGATTPPDDRSVFWLSNQRHDPIPSTFDACRRGCELVRHPDFSTSLSTFASSALPCGLPPTGMILSSANMNCTFLVISKYDFLCRRRLLLQGMHCAGKNQLRGRQEKDFRGTKYSMRVTHIALLSRKDGK